MTTMVKMTRMKISRSGRDHEDDEATMKARREATDEDDDMAKTSTMKADDNIVGESGQCCQRVSLAMRSRWRHKR